MWRYKSRNINNQDPSEIENLQNLKTADYKLVSFTWHVINSFEWMCAHQSLRSAGSWVPRFFRCRFMTDQLITGSNLYLESSHHGTWLPNDFRYAQQCHKLPPDSKDNKIEGQIFKFCNNQVLTKVLHADRRTCQTRDQLHLGINRPLDMSA